MTKNTKTAQTEIVVTPLETKRIADWGFAWATYQATLKDSDVPHILDQRLWAFAAARLQRGACVRWRNDSLTKCGELIVVACDVPTRRLELRELWSVNTAPATVTGTEQGGFSVKDFGVQDKFGIIRDADGVVVEKNIPSFDEAQRRIKVGHIPNLVNQQPVRFAG